jgi:beta-ribofuranosylaminobenzene 5'-phosphate synthase
VIYGVLASVMEGDRAVFEEGVKNIQHSRWKNAERSLYGNELLKVERHIYEAGATAVGMSSLGPSLYFLGNEIDTIVKLAKQKMPQSKFFVADVNNTGRSIHYD